MMATFEIPESLIERVRMIEGILTATATGGPRDDMAYQHLRFILIRDETIKGLLPAFVQRYRSLSTFWPYIKNEASTYAQRKAIIEEAFTQAIDFLERRYQAPADVVVSDALESFDPDGVHSVWAKAIARRETDPEGAITVARTLLETVCKRILDESGQPYTDKEDLPALYRLAAKALKLSPNQHTDEPIKAILGGAMNLVHGIGTLRNRFSDAHGRGGPKPVRPAPRHASLAVNTAGAIATFLVETHQSKKP
ncbi:abortive infection family protein [Larsenimonas rhizosphaerae]|uniref:Abortive infection family protein n=1 Tax=Larsenimonas rhizosphaerae TaxID=2944682 RepID=A0AA41ZP90_9GAMM|nr:abortive infection family protein [Larsenimonas rhizosphaerae]MCX2525583.1 abortive infection family protein [Larsenimonas rhizosphaerae]